MGSVENIQSLADFVNYVHEKLPLMKFYYLNVRAHPETEEIAALAELHEPNTGRFYAIDFNGTFNVREISFDSSSKLFSLFPTTANITAFSERIEGILNGKKRDESGRMV